MSDLANILRTRRAGQQEEGWGDACTEGQVAGKAKGFKSVHRIFIWRVRPWQGKNNKIELNKVEEKQKWVIRGTES